MKITKSNLITIITPHYKNKTLFRSMESVFKQNYSNIEYIIVCDGKTTYSEKNIYKYFNKYGSIKKNITFKVISEPINKGTIKALNMAIKESSGEIIFFLADDDIFADEFVISDWVKHFSEINNIVSFAKMARYDVADSSNCNIFPSHEDIDFFNNSSKDDLYDKIAATNFIFGACTAYKKECFEKYGFFDERFRLIEDQSMNLRLIRLGVKIDFFDRVAINYQNGGCSGIENIGDKYLEDSDNIFLLESSKYSKNPNEMMNKYLEWRNGFTSKNKSVGVKNLNKINIKEKQPLFTIAIVTFQQRHLLNDCLESIFKQDYNNIELIVCDDNSCDFDENEIKNYIRYNKSNNIKKVTVFKQTDNVGTTANIQKALDLATGIYIKFQAGDDFLYHDNVLNDILTFFKNNKDANVIATKSRACQHDGRLTDDYYPFQYNFDLAKKATPKQLFKYIGTEPWGAFVNAPGVFWKREYLKNLGGFDLSYKYTEDWPIWLKICNKGDKISYYDYVTVIYRYGGVSNDGSWTNKVLGLEHYNECIRMLETYVKPKIKKDYGLKARIRCWQSIQCIKARIEMEYKWNNYSLFSKMIWKIKKIPFLTISNMYRFRIDGKTFKYREILLIMFLCSLFYFLRIPLVLHLPFLKIYSFLFLGLTIWCVINFISVVFWRIVNHFYK